MPFLLHQGYYFMDRAIQAQILNEHDATQAVSITEYPIDQEIYTQPTAKHDATQAVSIAEYPIDREICIQPFVEHDATQAVSIAEYPIEVQQPDDVTTGYIHHVDANWQPPHSALSNDEANWDEFDRHLESRIRSQRSLFRRSNQGIY